MSPTKIPPKNIQQIIWGIQHFAGGKALADDISQYCTIHRALSNVKREERDSFLSFSAAAGENLFSIAGENLAALLHSHHPARLAATSGTILHLAGALYITMQPCSPTARHGPHLT